MVTVALEDEPAEVDIGELGERQFALWCTRAGLVANKSDPDRTGWDFVVEYPAGPHASPSPFLLAPSQITCKVQVKSTRRTNHSVYIKLDNLVRMATDPHPWFVVAVSFDGTADDDIRAVHMLPIEDEVIKQIEAAVKAAPVGTRLHEKQIRVAWDADDALQPPYHASMNTALRDHVGPSMWDYGDRKRQWNSVTAFEQVLRTVTILPTAPDAALSLISDLAIGAVTRIPFDAAHIAGLPIPEGAIVEDLYLELPNRASIGRATVTLRAGDTFATLRCQTFSSQGVTGLPERFWRLRFASTFLSLSIQGRDIAWHLEPPPPNATLRELGETGRALRVLARHDAAITVTFEDLAPQTFRIGIAGVDAPFPPDVVRFAEAVEHALFVARYFGLDDEMQVSARVLVDQERRLKLLRGLLDPRSELREVRVTDTDAQEVNGRDGAVVVCPGALLGDQVILVCAAVVGRLRHEVNSTTVSVTGGTARMMATRVVPRAEWQAGLPTALIEEAARLLVAEGLIVVTV